jgi:hypothetical protein
VRNNGAPVPGKPLQPLDGRIGSFQGSLAAGDARQVSIGPPLSINLFVVRRVLVSKKQSSEKVVAPCGKLQQHDTNWGANTYKQRLQDRREKLKVLVARAFALVVGRSAMREQVNASQTFRVELNLHGTWLGLTLLSPARFISLSQQSAMDRFRIECADGGFDDNIDLLRRWGVSGGISMRTCSVSSFVVRSTVPPTKMPRRRKVQEAPAVHC